MSKRAHFWDSDENRKKYGYCEKCSMIGKIGEECEYCTEMERAMESTITRDVQLVQKYLEESGQQRWTVGEIALGVGLQHANTQAALWALVGAKEIAFNGRVVELACCGECKEPDPPKMPKTPKKGRRKKAKKE